ncbi:MAG: hypothetical protein ABIB79_02830 [archaeon]
MDDETIPYEQFYEVAEDLGLVEGLGKYGPDTRWRKDHIQKFGKKYEIFCPFKVKPTKKVNLNDLAIRARQGAKSDLNQPSTRRKLIRRKCAHYKIRSQLDTLRLNFTQSF